MITSVDTNVLFDLFRTDSTAPLPVEGNGWLPPTTSARSSSATSCTLSLLPRLPVGSPWIGRCKRSMRSSPLSTPPSRMRRDYGGSDTARPAGRGERIISDFLIGAHAVAAADGFLTRDRGFYATYFPELKKPEAK